MKNVSFEVHRSFDSPRLGRDVWDELWGADPCNPVFLSEPWQRAWWESFGRGELLLVTARCGQQTIALAPLFADSQMVYLVGSGGSDYLGMLGNVADPTILCGLLDAARQCVDDFTGFVLYMVPDGNPLARQLHTAGQRLGLQVFDEGELLAPQLRLTDDAAFQAANKPSLVRRERYFQTHGELTVQNASHAAEILPCLDSFFEQHIARWQGTPYPSLFVDPQQRAFYRRLTVLADDASWLRFTRADWNGEPIAFHFGFSHGGRYLWYKPSFAIEWARRSPGQVLLRQLLLAAVAEGASVFDFGIGEEAFKRRFASHVETVRQWGLYEPSRIGSALKHGAAC